MTEEPEKRRISRQHLIELRHRIANAGVTPPPRELDGELFRLTSDHPTRYAQQDEAPAYHDGRQLLGRQLAYDTRMEVRDGEVVMADISHLTESERRDAANGTSVVPFALTNAEDAIFWKNEISGWGRLLRIEELEAEYLPNYQASIVVAGEVVASAESEELGVAIVLAVLDDLISNSGTTGWIEVTD